jgi:predicted Zn finger-like uncharacterized protein
MIITCPSCATRYQVDAVAFPNEGRRVKCARCANRWHAVAEPDLPAALPDLESAATAPDHAEAAADGKHGDMQAGEIMSAPDHADTDPGPDKGPDIGTDLASPTEAAISAVVGGIDDIEAGARFVSSGDEEFDAMAAEFSSERKERRARGAARGRPLPSDGWKKRMKRSSRAQAASGRRAQAMAIGGMLCGLALLGLNRDSVVQAAPHMASLFTMVGMPVNVRGIAFASVKADFGAENGIPVMRISGRMHNISGEKRRLAPIRLALVDDDGREVYHWTTDAGQALLETGESLPFQSILTSPPAGAKSVRVRFAQAG